MRILIAEDDPVSRLILQKAIQRSGHDCLVANDGEEAWACFLSTDVDVVISDWMMPRLDGVALCHRVRAHQGRTYPYFILLTALADKSHLLAGLEAGAADYLTKPLDRDELQVRLIAASRVTGLYRQLAPEQAETRAVLDATDDAILFVGPDHRIHMCNRQFVQFVAIPVSSLLGRTTRELQSSFSRIFFDAPDMETLLTGTPTPSIDMIQHWPVRRELVLSMVAVGDVVGGTEGYVYAFRDITSERAADRIRDEHVSLVSHELRTPLTSIKGYVELLTSGDTGDLTEEQHEFLGIASRNTDRMIDLLNDLLDLSHLESGVVPLDRTACNLALLIGTVVAALCPKYERKHQTLTVDTPDALPATWGDEARIEQIMTNLLSNAHKYTPVGGAVTVTARQVEAMIRVSVRDTGIGLTPEDLAQLFKKFFRAKNQATQEAGGTGLGLAITRALVERHGGTVLVTSAPGEGSTFSMTLPVLETSAST